MSARSDTRGSGSVVGRLLGALVFLAIPLFAWWTMAALLVARSASRLIAGGVAGVVLVAPFAWHVLAERRARGATAPRPGTLRGRDRLGLRILAVAALALALMFGAMRRATLDALHDHAGWPWHGPTRVTPSSELAELLLLLPVDARSAHYVDPRGDVPLRSKLRSLNPSSKVRAGPSMHTGYLVAHLAPARTPSEVRQMADVEERPAGVLLRQPPGAATLFTDRYEVGGAGAALVAWIERLADGHRGTGNPVLLEAARRVRSGVAVALLEQGTWLGEAVDGLHDTTSAMYPTRGGYLIELTGRFRDPASAKRAAATLRARVRDLGESRSERAVLERLKVRVDGALVTATSTASSDEADDVFIRWYARK